MVRFSTICGSRCGRRRTLCAVFALFSRQDFVDHVAVNVGQSSLGAVVVEAEPRVIEPQQVQDRGVEVVDRRRFSTAR